MPTAFPRQFEKQAAAYDFYHLSSGNTSSTGRWTQGQSIDGRSMFRYVDQRVPYGKKPKIAPAPVDVHQVNEVTFYICLLALLTTSLIPFIPNGSIKGKKGVKAYDAVT